MVSAKIEEGFVIGELGFVISGCVTGL